MSYAFELLLPFFELVGQYSDCSVKGQGKRGEMAADGGERSGRRSPL
jgi:hypothetical protein